MEEHVEALNARFRNGRPSNDLSTAGLLIRQFDKLDDAMQGRPWLPCPTSGWAGWCAKFHDIWATSLILKGGASSLYDPWGSGIVLSPTVTLNCAYASDGNSMGEERLCNRPGFDGHQCIPGCSCDPTRSLSDGPACNDGLPPTQLKRVVADHLRFAPMGNIYNEIVVNTASVVDQLPGSVAAFFYPKGADSNGVREYHRNFLNTYGLTGRETGRAVPLLELDFANQDAVFALGDW